MAVQIIQEDYIAEDLKFTTLSFGYFLSQIRPEGYLAYEYNPLRNFRITQDTLIV